MHQKVNVEFSPKKPDLEVQNLIIGAGSVGLAIGNKLNKTNPRCDTLIIEKNEMKEMSAAAIRKQLHGYLEVADDRKLKAIYVMVADEINTKTNDWDKDFVKELKKRSRDFQSGKAKTFSWEETKQAAIKNAKDNIK